MTVVVVPPGKLCESQPNRRLPKSAVVAPLGPQLISLTTPVLVCGSNAPSTAFGWSGSVTSRPPLQGVPPPPRTQPGGLCRRYVAYVKVDDDADKDADCCG